MIRYMPEFTSDLVEFLREREAPATDLEHIHELTVLLKSFPNIGEHFRSGIRRRYLPRLRAHVYYRVVAEAKRLDVLRLWPAYRRDPRL